MISLLLPSSQISFLGGGNISLNQSLFRLKLFCLIVTQNGWSTVEPSSHSTSSGGEGIIRSKE